MYRGILYKLKGVCVFIIVALGSKVRRKERRMDEKQRRFRTHVVKEIVETERVYTEQVAFVAEVRT